MVSVPVDVDVEYCGHCNFSRQCNELSNFIKEKYPDIDVKCHQGRQGAFEIKINDELIYSKIQAVAFPEYQSIINNIENVKNGEPLIKVKEQTITECSLM